MDRSLVTFVKSAADRLTLIIMAACLLAFAAVWSAALHFTPHSFPRMNQAEENRSRVVSAALGKPAAIGLAGTSLTYRLEPYLFEAPASNVALAGGNPATSVKIAEINAAGVIVVEINILDRASDKNLEELTARAAKPFLGMEIFRMATTPSRAATAAFFGFDKQMADQQKKMRDGVNDLLAKPPAPALDPASLGPQKKAWEGRVDDKAINTQNAVSIMETADRLNAAGKKVYYVLLPVHEELQKTAYYKRGYTYLRAADPKFSERFLDIKWDYGQIRWDNDGAHLDQRSAAIAARQIELAVRK